MLTITEQQLAAFEKAAVDAYTASLVRHLRRVIPEKLGDLSDRELMTAVAVRVSSAMSHGILGKADARRYVECSYVLDWPDGQPPTDILSLLDQPDITPEEKVDRIEQRTANL